MTLTPGLHTHLNWYFSEPGLYVLSFAVSASRVDTSVQTIAYATVRFFLGDLADLPETEPTVLTIGGFNPPYFVGDTMELSAQRYGAELGFETTWLRQCLVISPEGGSVEVGQAEAIGVGDTLSHSIVEADYLCQFRPAVFDGDIEGATAQGVQPSPW